jgi:hypothetical protein
MGSLAKQASNPPNASTSSAVTSAPACHGFKDVPSGENVAAIQGQTQLKKNTALAQKHIQCFKDFGVLYIIKYK